MSNSVLWTNKTVDLDGFGEALWGLPFLCLDLGGDYSFGICNRGDEMGFFKIMTLFALTGALAIGFVSEGWAHPPDQHSSYQQGFEETYIPELEDEAYNPELEAEPSEQVSGRSHDDTDMAEPDGDVAATHVDDGHHDIAQTPQSGHAHWGDNGPQTGLERAFASLGRFHSLFVHFPIALLLAAALAQAMRLISGREKLDETVRFLVWTAALGAVAAGFFGWAHSGPQGANEQGVMLVHRWLGTSLALGVFAIAMSVEWHRLSHSRVSALMMNISIFGGAIAVAVNGFLGGALAHGGMRHLMGG